MGGTATLPAQSEALFHNTLRGLSPGPHQESGSRPPWTEAPREGAPSPVWLVYQTNLPSEPGHNLHPSLPGYGQSSDHGHLLPVAPIPLSEALVHDLPMGQTQPVHVGVGWSRSLGWTPGTVVHWLVVVRSHMGSRCPAPAIPYGSSQLCLGHLRRQIPVASHLLSAPRVPASRRTGYVVRGGQQQPLLPISPAHGPPLLIWGKSSWSVAFQSGEY